MISGRHLSLESFWGKLSGKLHVGIGRPFVDWLIFFLAAVRYWAAEQLWIVRLR